MKKLMWILPLMVMLSAFPFVAAVPPEKTDSAFVCPVFNNNSAVGEHNPNAVEIGGGDYTVLPGARGGHGSSVSVPVHATNGDGAGSPPGPHSQPGDTNYTAIWSGL